MTPHPLNDLAPAQVEDLARAVYPLIIVHLTGQGVLESTVRAPFEHPTGNAMSSGADDEGGAG